MEPRLPFDDRFPDGPPLYGCATCHKDFASLAAFDQHFERFDRRMTCGALNGGWLQNERGRFTTVKLAQNADKLREYHADRASEPRQTP
jgi:hypothetical protein